jgi:ketosteroid isomerase-like protein
MAAEDTFLAEREVVATRVLAKQDGRWLIAAHANTPAK